MCVVDLEVGDIVKKAGDDRRYLVTSLRPSKGLKDYITLMSPDGHFRNVWVNVIEEKAGHINLDCIFEALGNSG